MHYCLVAFPETSNSLSDWPYSASPIGYSINATLQCGSISSCPTCLHTTFNCVWCGHNCQYAKCTEGLTHTKAITSLEHCQVAVANTCRLLHRQVRLFSGWNRWYFLHSQFAFPAVQPAIRNRIAIGSLTPVATHMCARLHIAICVSFLLLKHICLIALVWTIRSHSLFLESFKVLGRILHNSISLVSQTENIFNLNKWIPYKNVKCFALKSEDTFIEDLKKFPHFIAKFVLTRIDSLSSTLIFDSFTFIWKLWIHELEWRFFI